MGLLRAAQDYDPSRGTWIGHLTRWARSALDFASWKAPLVRGARRGPRPYCSSLNQLIGGDDDGGKTFLDALESPVAEVPDEHPPEELQARLALLKPKRRRYVELRLAGMTALEIAEQEGCHQLTVAHNVRRALIKMQRLKGVPADE
jgi:DNA-directed RNA polymerase specialized sigma24 family protein